MQEKSTKIYLDYYHMSIVLLFHKVSCLSVMIQITDFSMMVNKITDSYELEIIMVK